RRRMASREGRAARSPACTIASITQTKTAAPRDRRLLCKAVGLAAPVAFDPEPLSVMLGPMTRNPAVTAVARLPMPGCPDIVVAFPTPEAGLPFEVGSWTRDDDFVPERRRAAVHINNFRLRGRDCSDQRRKGQHCGSEQNLNTFHDRLPS